MAGVIKVALVCDSCGKVISVGISANEVRLGSQALYRRHEGKDLCATCEALPQPSPPPKGEKPSMSELFFTCPKTLRQAPTGIGTDAESLRTTWKSTLKLDCPHCGEVHEISVRETYLNSALRDANERS